MQKFIKTKYANIKGFKDLNDMKLSTNNILAPVIIVGYVCLQDRSTRLIRTLQFTSFSILFNPFHRDCFLFSDDRVISAPLDDLNGLSSIPAGNSVRA